jgi:GT2 family glycosyltransferase
MLSVVTEGSSSLPSSSIVIPTFNRLGDLRRVIEAVLAQVVTVPSPCQVVVVDDGSNDGTDAWLFSHADDLGLTVLRQANAGPARARNRGVSASEGEVVLFLGDDTRPQPGWLLEHLEAHRIDRQAGTVAMLGYTSFPREADSPFLRWINEHGAQFGYALIDDPTNVPFNFFYTSNVSIPRRFFEDLGGFREDFPAAAWEDIEFAYRAVTAGLSLRYIPRARTIHDHDIRVSSFCERQRTSGLSAAIFAGLHPELEGFLGVPCIGGVTKGGAVKRVLLRGWIALGELVHGVAGPGVYRRFLDSCYLEGLSVGIKSRIENHS